MYKIDFSNIVIDETGGDDYLFRVIGRAILKRKSPKQKEPKGNAKDGAYCPKEKTGLSWAHIDKSKNEDKEEEDNEALSNDSED